MQLTPRYDGPDVLRIEVEVGDPSVPMVRQRRRLASALAALPDDAWSVASRCEGWSVRDVIAHLVGTNQYWTISITSALAGSPTRFLESFDPVATPAAMVESVRAKSAAEVLQEYVDSTDALAAAVDGLGADAWSVRGEAPPGHIELRAVVLHALWDAWTHERDVLLPLGDAQALEADEVRSCLVYAAAIGPALLAAQGSDRRGVLAVSAREPDVSLVVEAGECVVVREGIAADADAVLEGSAVELIEGLTLRAPLSCDVVPDSEWLLGGLAQAFDVARS